MAGQETTTQTANTHQGKDKLSTTTDKLEVEKTMDTLRYCLNDLTANQLYTVYKLLTIGEHSRVAVKKNALINKISEIVVADSSGLSTISRFAEYEGKTDIAICINDLLHGG